MTTAYPIAHNTEPAAAPTDRKAGRGRVYFEVSRAQWMWDTLFILSLTMVGLSFPLGYPLVLLLLLRAFKQDREGFLFMVMLTAGGYALTYPNTMWGINLQYILFMVSVYAAIVLRKHKLLTYTLIAYGIYAATSLLLAIHSPASLREQAPKLLHYLSFITFTAPLLCFANHAFDIHRFWSRVFSMQFIICLFYVIDCYFFNGYVLVPCLHNSMEASHSTWNDIIMYGIGSNVFPRRYPPGLYPLGLLIYPLVRHYKLRWFQWAVILLSLICSQTFTMWTAMIAGFLASLPSLKRYTRYIVLGAIAFVALYFIDDAMGYFGDNGDQSTLRIASSINQFTELKVAEDDEDLAEFGSNRMAQLLPCLDHFYEGGYEWLGEGFIPLDTRNPMFLMKNEFFEDEDKVYTMCQEVEIIQAQILLEVGYIGLAIHCLFLVALWMIVRRLRYSRYFLSVLFVLIMYGTNGMRGWHDSVGIYLGALAYAVVILANRRGYGNPEYDDTDDDYAPAKVPAAKEPAPTPAAPSR